MGEFVTKISEVKRRAREHMERGALIEGYKGNAEETVRVLNEALATEIICYLRYKNHAISADGIHAKEVAGEFEQHAQEEREHADMLADRIDQLGGSPNYNPTGLTERSHTDYVECNNLIDMIKENLYAERIAIEIYGDMIRYFGTNDPTTRRMLEHILRQEEEHADDMAKFLRRLDEGAGSSQLRAEREKQDKRVPIAEEEPNIEHEGRRSAG